MKKLIYFLSVITLSSCANHIYITKCDDNIKPLDAYTYENDTLKITYDFWTVYGKMDFTIYNKLNVPIFIDFKNSTLILNDKPYPYWVDKTNTKYGGVSYNGINAGNRTSIHENRITFIPAHSSISKRVYNKLYPNKNFRNYIAYSFNEDLSKEYYIDNGFSIASVQKVKAAKRGKMVDKKNYYTDN